MIRASAFARILALLLLWPQLGAAQSQAVSLEDLQAAANADDAQAQYTLGLQYHSGNGVLEDYAQAAQWFERAAAQGHAPAQNALARYLFEGTGGTQDQARAMALFRQAAETGQPEYLFDLASVLETSEATAARAAALYQQAADAGLLEASVNLGVLYQDGRGVAQDFKKARALYEPAAEQGHPRALNNLGLLYVRGDGVPQDYAQAATLFTAAADRGLDRAMRNLGVLYENGYGVPLDEAKAAELYRLAGRGEGPLDTRTAKADVFQYDARLAPIDPSTVDRHALLASARAGDPVAAFQLGWLVVSATDEEVDFQHFRAAAMLFEAGAERGHGASMTNLAILYYHGWGLPQDYLLAEMWLLLADAAGHQGAAQVAAQFAGRFSVVQKPQVQSMAQDLSERLGIQFKVEIE